jgi:hypothetical protein
MKKEILKAFLIMAVVAAASTAYAAVTITSIGSTIGAQSFKPSNNVSIVCNASSSAWSANSTHTSGDRTFGASYDDPKMYWTTGTTISTFSDTSTWGGWNSL